MSTFEYTARDAQGERVSGTLTAGSRQLVLAELEARSLAPVRVDEVPESRFASKRVPQRRIALALQQVSDLLRAGVPLLRSLRIVARGKSSGRLGPVFGTIADGVADGQRLADAMAEHPDVFPTVQVAMVRAGERGGFLTDVLARMSAFLEKEADMKGKVVGNLIYPAFLLLVGVIIVLGALIFFVPRFRGLYTRIELPLPTKILLGASDLATTSGGWGLLIIAVLGGIIWWLASLPRIRRRALEIRLDTPVLGDFEKALSISRFTRLLGTLLGNGVPLLEAMEISRDAAGNPILAEAIDEAIAAVRAGEPLAAPLGESDLIADDVVEMIAVGEAANNLQEVLVNVAETIDKRVDRTLTLLLRLMEPILLLMLAGMVVFIFIALLVPMLRMSGSIGG